MPVSRSALLSGALIVVAIVAAVLVWRSRAITPDLARDQDQVSPSAEYADAEAAIEYYRAWLRREPDAVEPRVRLAQVLMQQARTDGREADYIPEARQLLDEALARDSTHYYARTLQASLYNTLHRFELARDLSRQLIAEYPAHAYTHGTLIDALVELGEYDEAVRVSDRLQALKPGLPAYSRASYLREIHGDTPGAIAAMRLAADAEPYGQLGRAWALVHLGGLYLGNAQPDTAAFVFEGILQERPNFAPALVGLGHVALARGDAAEAVRRLGEARVIAPSEAADELLVEAYTMLGDDARARAAAERVLESLHAAREMGEIVDMEEADFLADHGMNLDRALAMARVQVERRPAHLHANETYAWTLFKNGRAQEAIPYIQRAMALGTGDAMVDYRAAQIYRAAGRTAEAERFARLALERHVGIESPTAAVHAREMLAGTSGSPIRATSAR